MIGIDTNVVVRFIALDDPQQSPRAKALIDSEDVFVSLTVILEAGWVLTSKHGYPSALIVTALTRFLGLPRVSVDDPWIIRQALDWVGDGLDFADALHLSQARDLEGFATFDRKLANNGKHLSKTVIRLL